MNARTQLPLFEPHSEWQMPEVFPDFRGSKYIGFDTETCDPNLTKYGPGFVRKDAYIAGVSLANERGQKVYLPIAHQNGPNLPKNLVQRYVREVLSDESSIKVGANVLYDLEALKYDLDIDVKGKIYDVLTAEPLIDENQRTYNLDRLGELYTQSGKNMSLLEEAVAAWCPKGSNPRANIWRVPAKYAGFYAEDDAYLPVQIIQKQLKIIENDDLTNIFDLETRLIPCLFYMRRLGVRVDVNRAEQIMGELKKKEAELQAALNREVGMQVNVWSGADLAKAFDKKGEFFPRTASGNPSFEKKWLESNPAPLAQLITKVRSVNRIWSTFIKGTVLEHSYKGRIYCQFHPLKGDDGGAVTGRFSSSNPNLQQIPARDEELAPLVRSLFIPEEDHDWHCDDYSQIEPRLQVHYANIRGHKGAAEAASLYVNDPSTDFHTMTAELTKLPRKKAKNIHLGISYGMGLDSLASNLGTSKEEAKVLREQYNEYMPFLDGISREVNNRAAQVGFIRTIEGRKRRFNQWEPAGFDRKGRPVATKEEALELYGPPVRRADTRKAFNSLVQGSAADVIKKAMVTIYESGILSEVHMHLTVHDELDNSVPKGRKDLGDEVVRMMQNAVKCTVPLKVDNEIGPNWGSCK